MLLSHSALWQEIPCHFHNLELLSCKQNKETLKTDPLYCIMNCCFFFLLLLWSLKIMLNIYILKIKYFWGYTKPTKISKAFAAHPVGFLSDLRWWSRLHGWQKLRIFFSASRSTKVFNLLYKYQTFYIDESSWRMFNVLQHRIRTCISIVHHKSPHFASRHSVPNILLQTSNVELQMAKAPRNWC